jgi:hypothetical protein
MRIALEHDPGKIPRAVEVSVEQGIPDVWHFVVAFLVLGLGPLFVGISKFVFESNRWSNSDFSPSAVPIGGGEDDDE